MNHNHHHRPAIEIKRDQTKPNTHTHSNLFDRLPVVVVVVAAWRASKLDYNLLVRIGMRRRRQQQPLLGV